jgi:hypothetical protein
VTTPYGGPHQGGQQQYGYPPNGYGAPQGGYQQPPNGYAYNPQQGPYPQQSAASPIPQQRTPRPPAPKKRRKWPFVVGGLVVLLVIIMVASGGKGSDPTTGTASGAAAAQPAAAVPNFPGAHDGDVAGKGGDTLTSDNMAITATPLKAGSSVLGKTLCTSVTIVNNGKDQDSYNALDWKLQDPAGAAVSTGFVGSDNALNSGDLAPGGTASGDVCFDNKSPKKGQYVLLYQGNVFINDRLAWLNQL